MQSSTDRDPDVGLVLVGFSPQPRLAAIARHLAWPGLVLSDPERLLYARLGLGRAPLWRVYSPGTLAVYARALRARANAPRMAKPDEDTRQLGGDAALVDSTVRTLWRPRSPDDRPDAAAMWEAVGRLSAAGDPGQG